MNRAVFTKKLIPVILFSVTFINLSRAVNPEEMFPKMDGWELNKGELIYTPDNLWDIINGAADAYLSYDFQKLYTAEYVDNQDRRIRAYIFEHSNPTNSFGIYSQERSEDYEFNDTGAQGFKSGDAYYFISGPYYVQLTASGSDMSDPLERLAQQMEKSLNQNNELPGELKMFPEKGKVKLSEKYIATSFLGYGFLHSAFVANYRNGDNTFQIFIVNPENAEETGNILNNYLDFVKLPEDQRDNRDVYKIKDPYNGQVLLYRKVKYLYGIMGADDQIQEEYLKLLRKN
jgi:hypothetical protein